MTLYLSPEPEPSTIMLIDGLAGCFEATPTRDGLEVRVTAYTKARLDGTATFDADITVRLVSNGGPLGVADVTLHGKTAADHQDLIAWVLTALEDADTDGSVEPRALVAALSERLREGVPHDLHGA